MDAGFYRGTNAEQDNRFTDKEKKLLKQMKFEPILDTKVDLSKVNIEVVKPWITVKLNDILGMEDDVVIEYVFTQLEDQKNLNPKVMQINLTGFLNARRSREFVAELWEMFVEAASSPDGIPKAIVEKKMKELKEAAGITSGIKAETVGKARDNDWQHRYKSLTGGRYGKQEPNFNSESERQRDRSPVQDRSRGDRDERDRDRDRDRDRRIRDRDSRDRDSYRRRRSRTRSPPLPPRRRRFKEDPSKDAKDSDEDADEKGSNDDRLSNGSDSHKKKKKRKHRRHSSEPENDAKKDGDESGAERKKKHKKEKKKKHKKDRD